MIVMTYDSISVSVIIRKTEWAHLLAPEVVAVTGRKLVVAISALASTGNVASAYVQVVVCMWLSFLLSPCVTTLIVTTVLLISRLSVRTSVLSETPRRLTLKRRTVVKATVSISGTDSVIMRLAWKLRSKKSMMSMTAIVLVRIPRNLPTDVCIVCGRPVIRPSLSLIGSRDRT